MAGQASFGTLEMSAARAVLAGLTSVDARRRLAQFGPNAIAEQAPPRWRVFLAKFWSRVPWMLEAAFVLQLVVVSVLALSGILMAPMSWQFLAAVFVAAAGFALILDQIKLAVTSVQGRVKAASIERLHAITCTAAIRLILAICRTCS